MLNWKLLLEFNGMIVATSNIFLNVNNNDTVIVKVFNALNSGWCDCVFTKRFEQVHAESSITKFKNLIVS